MREFVATDLEGTLSAGEAWRGLGDYFKTHGRKRDHQLFFAAHILPALLSRAGILDKQAFRNQWLADQAELLRGYTQPELDACAAWVVAKELWAKRRTTVLEELRKYHEKGCTIVIASGAYDPIAQAFGRAMAMDHLEILSTPLEMKEGRATGGFAGQIGVDALKAQRVRELVGKEGELVAAYGDTAADAAMLELAAQPVAVSPDAALLKIATERGWKVLYD
jgi:HAD superfamily phosphoserine phosphatase-like hydrolase